MNDNMIEKQLVDTIIENVCEIWETEFAKDYQAGWILREDSMKNSLYFHMRKRLQKQLEKNNLRIFTEYYIEELHYRADIAIVQISHWTAGETENNLDQAVEKVWAVFELKMKSFSNETVEAVYHDIEKLKVYRDYMPDTYIFLSVLFEGEDDTVFWIKKKDYSWTQDHVVELAAGYVNDALLFDTQRV